MFTINITGENSYCFGLKYYYWDWHKNNHEIETSKTFTGPNTGYTYSYWYIAPKYIDLKDEILNNKIYTLSLETFNNFVLQKANRILSTYYSSSMIASGSPFQRKRYNIKEKSSITLQHIMALILYTSFSDLCFEFTKTFRKIYKNEPINNCKIRNREYAHWSRLIMECTNVFGTKMKNNKIYYRE